MRTLNISLMNPVKAGYVIRPQFYPYTGFLIQDRERDEGLPPLQCESGAPRLGGLY